MKKPPQLFQAESEGKIGPIADSLSQSLESSRCSTPGIGFEKEKKMSKTPPHFEAKRENEKGSVSESSVSSPEQSDSCINKKRVNSKTQIKSNQDKQESKKTKDSNKKKVIHFSIVFTSQCHCCRISIK